MPKDSQEFHNRVYVASTAAGLFLIADGAFAYAALGFAGIRMGIPYVVALVVPAGAALAMILLAALIPALIPEGRFKAPLQWTLPIVFAALTFLAAVLVLQLGSTSSLSAPSRTLAPARVWLTGIMLGGSALIHVSALSVALWLRRPRT